MRESNLKVTSSHSQPAAVARIFFTRPIPLLLLLWVEERTFYQIFFFFIKMPLSRFWGSNTKDVLHFYRLKLHLLLVSHPERMPQQLLSRLSIQETTWRASEQQNPLKDLCRTISPLSFKISWQGALLVIWEEDFASIYSFFLRENTFAEEKCSPNLLPTRQHRHENAREKEVANSKNLDRYSRTDTPRPT